MDLTQKSHRYIAQFNTRFDKLKAMIEGKKDVLEPFAEVLNKFLPWTERPEVLTVKFEHLIGPNGGGDKQLQLKAVKEICNFIAVEVNASEMEDLCKAVYSTKSSTFNKGKIGNWKKILTQREKQWLNNALKTEIRNYEHIITV